MNGKRHKKENQYSPYDDKNIIFENKEKRIKGRKLGKYFLYLFITSSIVIFIVNITIRIKYDRVIKELQEIEESNNVILDYVTIINKVSPSIVSISDSSDKLTGEKFYKGNSTGVIIDKEGHILTNYSTIKDLEKVVVKLPSVMSSPIEAKIVLKDLSIDLAILKINCEDELIPIKMAKSNNIREGQQIAIVSNSIGDESISIIVPGIVSSKYKKISGEGNNEYSLLQITASVNEENAGGAICNSEGELVGITSLEITKKKNEPLFYYGLQLNELESVINSTNIFKKVLGIDEGGIIADNKDFRGYYIEELDKDGNGYKAGIRPTDIIIEIDDSQINKVEDLLSIFENKKKGDIINCKVLRNGEIKKIKITIDN